MVAKKYVAILICIIFSSISIAAQQNVQNYTTVAQTDEQNQASAQEPGIDTNELEMYAAYYDAQKTLELTNGQEVEVTSCDHPLFAYDENSILAKAIKERRLEDAQFIIRTAIGLGCKPYLRLLINSRK